MHTTINNLPTKEGFFGDFGGQYISDELKAEYSKLTDEDLLYLALCEVGYDTQTIALCFGFTNTHPINQRKFRLKERMAKA